MVWNAGFYVRPTVFADVGRQFTIAQQEIFGPVFSIHPYDSEEEAVAIADDTIYGLAGWVYSADLDHARQVARRMRKGRVYLNGARALGNRSGVSCHHQSHARLAQENGCAA